jgi:hypothetical protein
MHAPVAGAKEATQRPADKADNNRTEKRTPEAGHGEPRNDRGDKHQQKCVQDEDKDTHGDDDPWQTQQEQSRTHKCIENAQQKRGAEKRTPFPAVADSRHDVGSDENREGCHEPANYKGCHVRNLPADPPRTKQEMMPVPRRSRINRRQVVGRGTSRLPCIC